MRRRLFVSSMLLGNTPPAARCAEAATTTSAAHAAPTRSQPWFPPSVSSSPSRSPCSQLDKDPIFANRTVGPPPRLQFGSAPSIGLRSRLFSISVSAEMRSFYSATAAAAEASSAASSSASRRISRADRADAQSALFDYLHLTRSLHFTDAEHMSKNSPVFLQKLLSKLGGGVQGGEQGTGQSLARFLRYHPINEFEPFFESLGLKPGEFGPLLRRELMFLSDDGPLLHNYHSLCHYGVPRSKIGKMYKDGAGMFAYGEGVLRTKLRAYEELGLCTPTVIKLVTCCPELLVGDINVNFLWALRKLRSLGVELDLIRGCFSDKCQYDWKRIYQMISFLDRIYYNKKDLASFISKHPRFLFDDSGRKIYVLVAMLLKLGLNMDKVRTLFLHHPRILAGNFTNYLWQSVHFLIQIGMGAKDIARIVYSHPEVLGSCSCKSPDAVLKSLNVPAERLCEIIIADSSQFTYLASRKKTSIVMLPKVETHYLQEKTTFLLKLGYVENSDEMAKALSKFRGRGDQLQERFDLIVNAGLDYHTVSEMIKLVPQILNQSTGVIEKKMNYLLNHLGYPLESLVAFPSFLCYNMDKIKLRFSMFNWLKEQGIVVPTKNRKMAMSTPALSTILASSDARFVKYFVNLHPEGPNVWEKLKNSLSTM